MTIPAFTFIVPAAGPVVETDGTPGPLERALALGPKAHLGRGLLRPFRRDEKADFAHGEEEALVRACVGQVLGTRCSSETTQGELPWNTEFGSLLYLLRHRNNDLALQELARHYVTDALRRFEPRVRLKAMTATREVTEGQGENRLVLRLRYDVIPANTPGNAVITDVRQTVVV